MPRSTRVRPAFLPAAIGTSEGDLPLTSPPSLTAVIPGVKENLRQRSDFAWS
jgi:hypothetical protein